MRGDRILFATAAVDVCRDFLLGMGARVEVLGFTTVRWLGGRSFELWERNGRPPDPGRLTDLLHIVYKEADDIVPGGDDVWPVMLRPSLLKENVDGEAILWAAERLRKRSEAFKAVVVISDGAPVDDRTLYENGDRYLQDHLQEVLVRLASEGDVEVSAIALGRDALHAYPQPTIVERSEDVGPALLNHLVDLMSRCAARRAAEGGAPAP